MSELRAVGYLLALIVLGLTQSRHMLVTAMMLPLLVGLLAAELDRSSGRVSCVLIRGASRLLPIRDRRDFMDEWLDHVLAAGERGVLPLTRALSIAVISAPLLMVALRIGRSRAPAAAGRAPTGRRHMPTGLKREPGRLSSETGDDSAGLA